MRQYSIPLGTKNWKINFSRTDWGCYTSYMRVPFMKMSAEKNEHVNMPSRQWISIADNKRSTLSNIWELIIYACEILEYFSVLLLLGAKVPEIDNDHNHILPLEPKWPITNCDYLVIMCIKIQDWLQN